MAGSGRRTFKPGEVLTASNVMNYLQDQAVMTFAGTAARGSAIGTAVSEGMVSYLADTNVVQAYDGSAWNSLAYASSVPSANSIGLVPIVPTSVDKSGGTSSVSTVGQVTFTGVSSISLNGVFSSTYRNYKLVVNTEASSALMSVMVRLRTSGTDNTNNTYYQYWTIKRISGVSQDNSGGPSTAYAIYGKSSSNNYGSYSGDIFSPYSTSQATTVTGLSHGGDNTNSYNLFSTVLFDGTTSFDGISLYPSTGTFTGTVSIYGYND